MRDDRIRARLDHPNPIAGNFRTRQKIQIEGRHLTMTEKSRKSKKRSKSKAIAKGRDPNGLTPRQARFVEEYLVDTNATQAAIRAGYSKNGAHVTGSQVLSYPKVAAQIAIRRKELANSLEITQERVLLEYARVAFYDPRKLFDDNGNLKKIEDLDDDTARAIASTEVVTRSLGDGEVEYVHKVKAWDKLTALGKLAEHLGLFNEKPAEPANVYNDNRTVIINQVNRELEGIFGAALRSADRPPSEH